jgi:hypothetical protein
VEDNKTPMDRLNDALTAQKIIDSFNESAMRDALSEAHRIKHEVKQKTAQASESDNAYWEFKAIEVKCENLSSLYIKQAYTTNAGRTEFISVLSNITKEYRDNGGGK